MVPLNRRPHYLRHSRLAIISALCFLIFTIVLGAPSKSRADIEMVCSSVNARAVGLDDRNALMRDDGAVLTTEPYCTSGDYSEGLIPFGLCVAYKPKKFDFLTPEGRLVLTVHATNAKSFSEGLAAVQNEKGLWGYINKLGEFVIPQRYHDAEPFSEGLAMVREQEDGVRKFIDLRGNTVLTPRFPGFEIWYVGGFKWGLSFVMIRNPKTDEYLKGLMNHQGKWVSQPTDKLVGDIEKGLAPMWSSSGEKLGFVDQNGRMVIEPQFTGNGLQPFEDGLAAVSIRENDKLRVGYIDEDGKWIIPPKFNHGLHFCGGLAPVAVGELWGYINKSGEMVIPAKYEVADAFDAGIASVVEKDDNEQLYPALINRHGKVLYRSSKATTLIQIH